MAALGLALGWPLAASAGDLGSAARQAADRLIAAYPDFLARRDDNTLIWRDGTAMPIDDGIAGKSFEQMLAAPDLKDQFASVYVPGRPTSEPGVNEDPGRVRYDALYRKMYGDCRDGGVVGSLVAVPWLPKHSGGVVIANAVNGLAARLKEVSDELDTLPDSFMAYLIPNAGIYNCRVIAGTDRSSMHAYGAAIDINTTPAHYWRNATAESSGRFAYHNEIPVEIVDIFERHGFIWGGKWYHYDTMHFEYRPELLPPLPPLRSALP